jgi:hypothetical protein
MKYEPDFIRSKRPALNMPIVSGDSGTVSKTKSAAPSCSSSLSGVTSVSMPGGSCVSRGSTPRNPHPKGCTEARYLGAGAADTDDQDKLVVKSDHRLAGIPDVLGLERQVMVKAARTRG